MFNPPILWRIKLRLGLEVEKIVKLDRRWMDRRCLDA